MGCWQKFREPLQDGRHGGDVEDEAREQQGWQKARKKPCLCCHKLPLHVYGDEKALAQGAEHEDGGDEKEGQVGTPEGHVEDQDGKDGAKDEGEHAKRKVGDEFSQYELQAGYGCCQHGLHGAALPLPGKDKRGQEGSNEGHDDRDGAWHKEVHALGRRVVPEALLHADLRKHNVLLLQEAPDVSLDHALRVGLQKACGIGFCPVYHKLQGGGNFPCCPRFGKDSTSAPHVLSLLRRKKGKASLVVLAYAHKALDCG